MALDDPNTPDDLRRRAVYWLTRMQSGDATHEEVDACAAWRRANPEHDRAYRSVEFFWTASGHLPQKKLRAILASGEAPGLDSRGLTRRQFGWGVAGACAAVAAGAIYLPAMLAAPALHQASMDTGKGASRESVLPDGSVLTLNVGTRLDVALYQDRRVIELAAGEVFLSVAPDRSRPFVVKAGDAVVTVTGTRFNVRRDASSVKVAVESGSVTVSSGNWWNTERRDLRAGQAVEVGGGGVLSEGAVNIQNVTAWRQGKIVLDNAPLRDAVAEMNRYLAHPAILDAAHLGDYRVAGVFSIDDPQSMLGALPAIAPVKLERLPDGRTRILARSAK